MSHYTEGHGGKMHETGVQDGPVVGQGGQVPSVGKSLNKSLREAFDFLSQPVSPAEHHHHDAARELKPRGDARFHALLAELGELHDRKQADYGREGDPFANVRASEDFGVRPWVGAMVRANDKMRRIQAMATRGVLMNEPIEDSLRDLAVYALIALILFRDECGRKAQLLNRPTSMEGL